MAAAAAAQDAVPEDDDDGVDQEGPIDGVDADAYAEPPFDEESVRERQLMAAEAGPSDAAAADDDEGETEQEFEELLQEPPFPEPELRPMLLCDLLGLAAEEEVAAMAHDAFPDLQIAGLSDDPASVMPGDIYCCVERITRSSVWNGHDPEAVAAALAAGAVAVLAEAGTDFPDGLIPDSVPVIYADEVDELATRLAAVLHESPGSNDMTVLSVLGTNGKTTTSWLIRGLLEQAGQLTGMVGSIEYALAEHLMNPDGSMWVPEEPDPAAGRECGSPFHLVPYKGRYCVEETTPSGLRVQKVLAGMRDRGATAAVLEVDTEALATGSLAWLEPTISVFTNCGDDPCSMFSSREEHLEVLLEHFRELQDSSKQRAVINIDDEAAAAVLQAASGVPCITFGINNAKADVRVESLDLSLWRTTMIVATPVGRLEIITNLIGRHNVYNVLAAVAVGVLLNLPLEDIGAGIESVQFVPGRCEVVNNELDLFDAEEGEQEQQQQPAAAKLRKDFAVAVDAANTPQRLAQVLDDLREAGAKRIFTVFGADGQVTTGESRARMGEVAHQRSDFVILTDADPGLEDPREILQDIVSGWPNELFEPYAAYVYNVFQSQTEVPLWFEPYLHSAQRRWKRHIMASRFQAIRAAIGTATAGDVVLLAGRGHKDWVEQVVQGQLTRGWLDDRVEARNALAKLEYLYALVDLDRSELIWGPNPSDGKTAVVEFD